MPSNALSGQVDLLARLSGKDQFSEN